MNTLIRPVASPAAPALPPASLPLLFVLLWSSGYPAGKLGLAHAGPLTLLSLRFGLAAVLLLIVALATGAPWPRRWQTWAHLAVVGALIQGLHFVGVYEAIHLGLPAGIAALMVGLMPLAAALGAHLWLAERMSRGQAWGLLGGVLGVGLVVVSRPMHGATQAAYAAALLGLLGLVAGTLYQKRFCADMDLRSGASVQIGVAALMMLPLAGVIEHFELQWDIELVGSVLWMVLVNAIGAFSLMFVLIRRGQASGVARLFFMIPGVSALMGFALLGEYLAPLGLAGFVVAALAVALSAGARR
ncbi:MAG: EamA family transporter [Paucibacter sp.]|nr:EamA family transporter [Roseateles sp.]